MNRIEFKCFSICCLLLVLSCTKQKVAEDSLFKLLEGKTTGLTFSNDLELSLDLNIFNYMYFFNGGGVGAGDFNNDGLIDLFFAGNQAGNQFFINKGDLKFEEVTEQAGLQYDSWSTGVAVVDINNDGLLDIYVNELGDFKDIKGHNKLFVSQGSDDGVPIFEEMSEEYGLDLVGFSTHSGFFDYDGDGDLDLFQLNHSLHANGTFGQRKTFLNTFHPLSGDKIFQNESGTFKEVTPDTGINSSVVGYGLGLAFSDLNMDGFPDLYVGNDFHENDYLYINNKNGAFEETLTQSLMHTSRFSMGVDMADMNNDGLSDIISLDMLPYDPFILKSSEGEDAFGTFYFKLGYGYNHQYAKNCLQRNNGDGTFSDVAMFGNVHATDWSWASLLFDIDQDGQKDIFISNGIPKRMNDIDYINFVKNEDLSWKTRNNMMEEEDLEMVKQIPEIKLPNQVFLNQGNFNFSNGNAAIINDKASYSNGALYADLDNDGDLDVVTNNINDQAFLYENLSNKTEGFISLELKGAPTNLRAIGTKVIMYLNNGETILTEKFPYKGFQSSMEGPLHIAYGGNTIDSTHVIWPDNTYQTLSTEEITTTTRFSLAYQENLPAFDYTKVSFEKQPAYSFSDVTEATALDFSHKENPFIQFDREPLIPHATSTEGPALAVGDVNGDGLEDIYLGGAKRQAGYLAVQQSNGKFKSVDQEAFSEDEIYEDVEAHFLDVDNDNDLDLVVASGGDEFWGESKYRQPRVYLNDGKANLTRLDNAFEGIYTNAQTVTPHDFNEDGFVDLFVGSRSVTSAYGEIPTSYLMINDGTGKFNDVTVNYSSGLSEIGMVKDSKWEDLDQDGKKDLIVAVEWDGVYAFMNKGTTFEKKRLTSKNGWWNFVLPLDYDNDGDLDIVVGNLGKNSRLKASEESPIRMYYNDFDQNGKKEQILTYYLEGKEIPFSNMMELQKQIPLLKKKYLFARDFAAADLTSLLGKDQIAQAAKFEANFLENCVLINDGNLNFETIALPDAAQMTPYMDGIPADVDEDGYQDVLLFGNFYGANIQMGRYDSDYGTVLKNNAGQFDVESLNGTQVKGQVRVIKPLTINGQLHYILARNNDRPVILKTQ